MATATRKGCWWTRATARCGPTSTGRGAATRSTGSGPASTTAGRAPPTGWTYSGEVISKEQTAKGIEPPVLVWVPSIAPSGFALYLGDQFPDWTGDFFVGGLGERSLRRVRIREGEVVLQEVLLRELRARIRDVRVGPDGYLYLLTDDPHGMLLRLRPRR